MASLGWRVIRMLFGVGEKVAPYLVGRAAFELFARTPSPHRQTDGERRAIARAAVFMQTARHHKVKVGPDCVAIHEFGPEAGAGEVGRALVVHGWRSRTEYMKAIVEGLRGAGFRVFAIDLPGHGGSTGRRLTMMKGIDAVSAADQWFGPFDVVVGHSFGGAIAVNAAAASLKGTPPLAAERLVLIAAPNAISGVIDDFCRQTGLGARSQEALVARIERVAQGRLDEFTGSRQLARLTVATLIVHAPNDREVPAADASAYGGAGNHVSLHWAPGLGHRRILSDAIVVSRVVSFALQPVPLALAV
jgi:pimeloyl-ACP methyl ester carboxylesterase